MARPRVHGGIFTNQVMSGNLRFFKMVGTVSDEFANTISAAGTVIIPGGASTGGATPVTTQFYVATGAPVPGSAAERAVTALLERGTLVLASIISDSEIHLVFDDSGFGWDTAAAGDAAAEMEDAVQALGVVGGGAIDSSNPPVPDLTNTGTTVDLSAVTIAEVTTFELV